MIDVFEMLWLSFQMFLKLFWFIARIGYRSRGGSRTAATVKMKPFVIIVNGWKSLTIITKRSILDVAAALDPLLCKTIYLTRKTLSDGNCVYTRTETRA